MSIGVKSDFHAENYEKVESCFLKREKEEGKHKGLKSDVYTPSCTRKFQGCPHCGKKFPRHCWLPRHVELCFTKQNKISKTVEELRLSLAVKEAIGGAIKIRKLNAIMSTLFQPVPTSLSTDAQCFYKIILKGSARKQAPKISIRFTNAQKEIIEFCFNEGEGDKRKRFTGQKCQKLMEQKLDEELLLTEKQI